MFITAEQRRTEKPKINLLLFGESGAGKTTQCRTLPPDSTLFLDLEGGRLAIQGWDGDVLDILDVAKKVGAHPWEIVRALSCMVGGHDPAAQADSPFSEAMLANYIATFDPIMDLSRLSKYDLLFFDSITKASRWCLQWCMTQPDALTAAGKKDPRGAYGLLSRELIQWLTQLQHCRLDCVLVGILDEIKDDIGRTTFSPQIEGSKTSREMPGIFDQVLTLGMVDFSGSLHRAFVCTKENPFGWPGKDRSGCLEMIERPDLGALIEKIRVGKRIDESLVTALPEKTEQ